MKYSFMTFSTKDLTLDEVFEVARRYGYDGVEPRLDSGHAHGLEAGVSKEQQADVRRRAEKAGVALACLATSLKFADRDAAEATIRDAHERIDLAGDVGAPAIRVFGGKLAQGFSREAASDLMVSSLRAVADHAAGRGVTICLETHDDWCDPAHVAPVMRRVAHPAVGINWDVMHPLRIANVPMEQAFETLKPWIRHTHCHDGLGHEEKGKIAYLPMGQGKHDHRIAMRLLKSIDYKGYLSGEWINWEPWEVHLPRELATLKRYEQELA